jgi:ubiquinone/menaquinone biosynthesis C-methylase UbiE
MSVKENEAFERIWQEWLRSRDLRAQVTRHIAERKAFLEFVETYVRQGATPHTNGCATRVLEVGCGSAIDSMYLAERLAVEFYACDLSENAIRVARRLSRHFARPVRFLAADIRKLSFAAETFDVVFSQGVL